MRGPYRVEFDEAGGYDCMSSAYKILDADNRTVATVDVTDFVKCSDWDTLHGEHSEAAEIAQCLLKGLST